MNNERLRQAKELFLKYGGSHFHMEREGDYQLYKSFNISDKQELSWIKEYQEQLLTIIKNENVVSSSFINLTRIICQYKDTEYINLILEIVNHKKEKVDSFTQIRMAEEIIKIYESLKKYNDVPSNKLKKLKITATELLNQVLNGTITVSDYYINSDFMEKFTIDENVINRASQKLKTIIDG